MQTTELLYLCLVLFAFATFSSVVLWVMFDDARNRDKRAHGGTAANDQVRFESRRAA
jgi:hypothetical protein